MVITALFIVIAILLLLWAWGAWLLRRDARAAADTRTVAQLESDHAYEMEQAAKRAEKIAARQYEDAFSAGVYHAAVAAGLEPVMPARNAAEARQQRLARRAVKRADSATEIHVDLDAVTTAIPVERAEDADSWWAQSAGRQNNPAPEGAVDSSAGAQGWGLGADRRWDAVRCADGRVKASLVLGRR